MRKRSIRYAVVGIGHIAQAAVLPAFAHAGDNSELAALVSGDAQKRRKLGRRYGVEAYPYEAFDDLMDSGEIDAVYIALPNHMHCEYAVRAARAGVHVLCEKPMAVSEDECVEMIDAAARGGVLLMIAYRLHFEHTNLRAAELVHSGRIGEPRLFNSTFAMQVKAANIRTDREKGGGPLYDIGVYCINAARSVFRAEPVEVCAFSTHRREPRFREIEDSVSAVLRFPGERIAAFTCSFGAADVGSYRVVGTKGDVLVEPAYGYVEELGYQLTVGGRTREHKTAKRDQFAPELLYFSDCIRRERTPEPSGLEGLLDVRVVEALHLSAARGIAIELPVASRKTHPSLRQERRRAPVRKVELVHAESASR